MKNIALTLAALASLAGAVNAAPAHKPVSCPLPAKTSKLICPVTGTKIASAKAAFGHSTFKGKTYYFCCPSCKPAFDKKPAYYVHRAAQGKYQAM